MASTRPGAPKPFTSPTARRHSYPPPLRAPLGLPSTCSSTLPWKLARLPSSTHFAPWDAPTASRHNPSPCHPRPRLAALSSLPSPSLHPLQSFLHLPLPRGKLPLPHCPRGCHQMSTFCSNSYPLLPQPSTPSILPFSCDPPTLMTTMIPNQALIPLTSPYAQAHLQISPATAAKLTKRPTVHASPATLPPPNQPQLSLCPMPRPPKPT